MQARPPHEQMGYEERTHSATTRDLKGLVALATSIGPIVSMRRVPAEQRGARPEVLQISSSLRLQPRAPCGVEVADIERSEFLRDQRLG